MWKCILVEKKSVWNEWDKILYFLALCSFSEKIEIMLSLVFNSEKELFKKIANEK